MKIPPFSKRAEEIFPPHSVGEQIELKGHGKIKFEIIAVENIDDNTYYKIKPISQTYAVPKDMIKEIQRKHIIPSGSLS